MSEIETKLNNLSKPPFSSEDNNDFLRPYVNLPNHSNSLVNGSKILNDHNDNFGIQIQGEFVISLSHMFIMPLYKSLKILKTGLNDW